MWVRRCFIVTAANLAYVKSLCPSLAGPEYAGMWPSAISPTGVIPATHYIEEGCWKDTMMALLPFSTVNAVGVKTLQTPGNAAFVAAAATANGMPTTTLIVQAMFDASDITDQPPFVAMARLGLQIINGP